MKLYNLYITESNKLSYITKIHALLKELGFQGPASPLINIDESWVHLEKQVTIQVGPCQNPNCHDIHGLIDYTIKGEQEHEEIDSIEFRADRLIAVKKGDEFRGPKGEKGNYRSKSHLKSLLAHYLSRADKREDTKDEDKIENRL